MKDDVKLSSENRRSRQLFPTPDMSPNIISDPETTWGKHRALRELKNRFTDGCTAVADEEELDQEVVPTKSNNLTRPAFGSTSGGLRGLASHCCVVSLPRSPVRVSGR
eukprot:1361002-Amorphochlora_amoeboformis.AAC.1